MGMSNSSLAGFSLKPGAINSQKKWDFQGGKKKDGFQREKKKGLLFKPVVAHLQVSK